MHLRIVLCEDYVANPVNIVNRTIVPTVFSWAASGRTGLQKVMGKWLSTQVRNMDQLGAGNRNANVVQKY